MPMRGELSMPAGRFSVHVIKSPSLKGSPQALKDNIEHTVVGREK